MNAQNPDFSEIIKKVVSNPEALSSIAAIIGNSPGNDKKPEKKEFSIGEDNMEPADQPEGSQSPLNEGKDMLSSLLSNPELMAKLPAMIEMMKPMLGNILSKPTPASKGEGAVASVNTTDRRLALLQALKPYLSKQKSETVDYMLRVMELVTILGNTPH